MNNAPLSLFLLATFTRPDTMRPVDDSYQPVERNPIPEPLESTLPRPLLVGVGVALIASIVFLLFLRKGAK